MHFDCNENFTIQLVGKKEWTYTDHAAVPNPTYNSGLVETPYHLAPREVSDPHTIVLAPGDVFYIPRGVWHGTRTVEDSLSLNFNLFPTCWADVLVEALRYQLHQLTEWRETASRNKGDIAKRLCSLAEITAALLPSDVATWERTDAEIVPATLLRRNPLVWWSSRQLGDTQHLLNLHLPGHRTADLVVLPDCIQLVQAIPSSGVVSAGELLQTWPHEVEIGLYVLSLLAQNGLVEPV
jgi:hypothetical protein